MFINDIPKRESVEREIGTLSADYVARIEGNALGASKMIFGCRCILNLWIEGCGSSIDDEVIGGLGIESQCDHVMLRPRQRKPRFPDYDGYEEAEIERLGLFLAVERLQMFADARQVHEPVDRTQHVVRRDMPLQTKAAEQRFLRYRPLAHHRPVSAYLAKIESDH